MSFPAQWHELRQRWSGRKKREIYDALDDAYAAAEPLPINPEIDKVIVFSDQHKGARDGADDFQRCERSYNAALAYYNKLGYRLVLLGDVEELWENRFERVENCYPRALALEAAFHTEGRYTRVWGNHDLAWKDGDKFRTFMRPHGLVT